MSVKSFELTACPLCGGTELTEFDLGGGNMLRRCGSCDAVSAPAYGDPDEIYVDGYLFGEGDFGLDVRHPVFQKYLFAVAERRLKLIERTTGGPSRLLDVGSGTGEILAAARDRGWKVQGVEPERSAADMARERGVEVIASTLEDSGLPERSWEVVSAFHVLEHIPNPVAFLRMVARWVAPGGHLVIEVPNFAGRQRQAHREAWMALRPLEHITHFTPRTLEYALRSAELEPVSVRSPSFVGPPQSLEQALWDLARGWRYERVLKPLSRRRETDGKIEHAPSRPAWAVLHAVEAAYDRRGEGTVVFAVARVP